MCIFYPNITKYLLRICLFRTAAFLTAVLLTPRAIAASVKLEYTVVIDVSISFTLWSLGNYSSSSWGRKRLKQSHL